MQNRGQQIRKRVIRKLLGLLVKSEFEREVLLKTLEINRGKTITYKELAQAIGKPMAYRAVGNALHNNPLPFIIPCHRVVRKGSIGGYKFGGHVKRFALGVENALPHK
ncbi:MAG: methylated-DNA--[protein]-cysteine S-methyltransferase [Candidatus Micrarchaeia archaeon]